jgi:hypothetical protein
LFGFVEQTEYPARLMSATHHRFREADHSIDGTTRGAVSLVHVHGNDNAVTSVTIDALTDSKRRIWERFVLGLMLGGLLFALCLLAVLVFVYSRYP